MKFKSRFALKSQEGKTRIVRKFLMLPRQFGDSEWRWLETADILESIIKVDVGGSVYPVYAWKWCEVGFADEESK